MRYFRVSAATAGALVSMLQPSTHPRLLPSLPHVTLPPIACASRGLCAVNTHNGLNAGLGVDEAGPLVRAQPVHISPGGEGSRSVLTQREMERMRPQLVALANGPNPVRASRARRTLAWLEIVVAKTPAERHVWIRRLPAATVRPAPADGRIGVTKSLMAGRRIRMMSLTPARPRPGTKDMVTSSGPADVDDMGSLGAECFFDDQPDECATEQELEDADIMAAQLDYETSLAHADYEATLADYDYYCSQNPWACDGLQPEALIPSSGPCADVIGWQRGCGQYAFSSLMSFASSASTLTRYWGARAGAAAMSTMTVTSHYIAIGAAGFAVGYTTAAFVDCYFLMASSPELGPQLQTWTGQESCHVGAKEALRGGQDVPTLRTPHTSQRGLVAYGCT